MMTGVQLEEVVWVESMGYDGGDGCLLDMGKGVVETWKIGRTS
jgi:hypothetical protein